ncbi:hypothetical protein ACLOJK_028981 [Asimina triloba]
MSMTDTLIPLPSPQASATPSSPLFGSAIVVGRVAGRWPVVVGRVAEHAGYRARRWPIVVGRVAEHAGGPSSSAGLQAAPSPLSHFPSFPFVSLSLSLSLSLPALLCLAGPAVSPLPAHARASRSASPVPSRCCPARARLLCLTSPATGPPPAALLCLATRQSPPLPALPRRSPVATRVAVSHLPKQGQGKRDQFVIAVVIRR